eukprot:4253475-Amphidinium_carterae.1
MEMHPEHFVHLLYGTQDFLTKGTRGGIKHVHFVNILIDSSPSPTAPYTRNHCTSNEIGQTMILNEERIRQLLVQSWVFTSGGGYGDVGGVIT